ARDGRVPETCAVEKRRHFMLARRGSHSFPFFQLKDPSAGAIVRVLDFDERGGWIVDVSSRPPGLQKVLGREDSVSADLRELHARVGIASPGLVPDRVALATDDDVVSRPSQHTQRDLVRHRAAREPERGFLAKEGRDPFLEAIDGRILAELIVAYGGGRHGRSHLWRREG